MAFRLRRRHRRAAVLALMAAALIAVGFAGLRALLPGRTDTEASRAHLARALTLLKLGSPTEARDAAHAATEADRANGLAHAVLARTLLALDDGAGAQAALERAAANGVSPKRTRQLLAHALLLQGDARRALAEAEASDPRYARYADRVRAEAARDLGDYARADRLFQAAVASRPWDGEAWVALGRHRQAVNDLGGAIAASVRAAAVAPRSADALLLRAEMIRAQYGLVASLPWFERAAARDPRNHRVLIEYAATLGDLGRTRDMLAVVRRAEAALPGSPQALYLQAVLAARAERFDLARAILQRTGGAIDGSPGVLLLRGILEMRAGGGQQAIDHFEALLARQPFNITARKLLAAAYARSDASRNAIATLRPLVERGDADSYALTLAARAHERIGERGAAAELLDRAARVAPGAPAMFAGDLPAAVAPIRDRIAAGDGAGALSEAVALARGFPGVSWTRLMLGDVLMAGGRAGEAAIEYRAAADLRFDEPTLLRLIEAYEAAGQRRAAAEALALFLSQNPANVAALRLAARAQLAGREYDAAIDTLEGLRARLGNRDATLLADLATAYLAVDEGERAVRLAAAAHALAPRNAAIADAYGWALRATGDAQGAVQLLRKAVALAPEQPTIRRHLVQALADRAAGA